VFVQQQQHPVTSKLALVFFVTFILGVIMLAVGVYLVIFMRYHERAYTPMALGGACFIGSIAGMIMPLPKIKAAFFYGIMALGIVGLLIGVNYLTYPFYQQRGYLVLGISVLCILGGIIGAIAIYSQVRMRACVSVMTLGILASSGIVALIVGIDHLLAMQNHQNTYALLGVGVVCLFGGIACAIFAQTRSHSILFEKKTEV
jgi:uncharacterized membrane protein HdeD (DUF308 family)